MSDEGNVIVFCEGCGARLDPHDRVCPKCGRPAPGILSPQSAASDLAAGKTASFPRLTPEAIADVKTPSAPQILTESFDPEATNVLDADLLAQADAGSRNEARAKKKVSSGSGDIYHKPRRGRLVAAILVLCLIAGGAWFVLSDPLDVMPGVYDRFDKAASDMFPSRQVSEQPATPANGEDSKESDDGSISDSTVSEDEAYQRLSALYGRILDFQDELGPVIDDFNGWFKAPDLTQRQDASKSAFTMRDNVQKVIDELDGLKLSGGSAYTEDVDHLRQLAGWMYNRVDVLCRSWDISLKYTSETDDQKPYRHEDEILAPLREIEMQNGKAVDVIQFESHIYEWQPQKK